MRRRTVARFTLLLAAACACACAGRGATIAEGEASARPPRNPPTTNTASTDDAGAGATMSTKNTRDKLPPNFDIRVRRALEVPLADEVVMAFDQVAMAKLPYNNYHWTLTVEGKLFYVQHSRKPGDWQVPFDTPLPSKPSMTVDPAKVKALIAKLEAAKFFDHPGYEASQAEDGSYWILRARRGKQVHAVVYQNVKPPSSLAEIVTLADSLWTQ